MFISPIIQIRTVRLKWWSHLPQPREQDSRSLVLAPYLPTHSISAGCCCIRGLVPTSIHVKTTVRATSSSFNDQPVSNKKERATGKDYNGGAMIWHSSSRIWDNTTKQPTVHFDNLFTNKGEKNGVLKQFKCTWHLKASVIKKKIWATRKVILMLFF